MIASGYSLDLYCENGKSWPDEFGHRFQEFPHQYSHEDSRACWRAARAAGWLLKRKECKAFCPKCVKAKRTT